jgi:hypothetical protein
MIFIKNEIKVLNGSADNFFIAVQTESNQSGYCGQYLRKMLRYEKLRGIKIGQLWLIECKSLHGYIEVAHCIKLNLTFHLFVASE